MSRARQNLGKRMRRVGLRHGYGHLSDEQGRTRATWGPEWERLRERRGMEPGPWSTREDVARRLSTNSVYGKIASGRQGGGDGAIKIANTLGVGGLFGVGGRGAGDDEACVSSDDVTEGGDDDDE